jgi:hypothetical protein
MVKKRKFSHKKFRMVKGGFTRFLHKGHSLSGEGSSLPQSGQVFIILLCNTSDLINDFMKTGILRRIFSAGIRFIVSVALFRALRRLPGMTNSSPR